jgi:hypothetical protein
MKSKRLKGIIHDMQSNQDLKTMLDAWTDPESRKALDEAYQKKFSSGKVDEDGRNKLDSETDVSEKEES